jgi:hypothetical protein
MADYRETHVWYDGRGWSIYTERPADARKAERLFGPAEERGAGAKGGRQVWNWRNLAGDVFRWGRKRRGARGVVLGGSARRDLAGGAIPGALDGSAATQSPPKRAPASRGGGK